MEEYKEDLKNVQSIFLKGKDSVSDPESKVPIYNHLPAII